MREFQELDLLLFKTAREIFEEDTMYAQIAQDRIEEVVDVVAATKVVRHNGLLALEEYANNLKKSGPIGMLRDMIFIIVDGTDPEFVWDIFTPRLYLMNPHEFDTYLCRIVFECMLHIQVGVNPLITLEMVASYVHEKYRAAFLEKYKEKMYSI